MIDTPAVVGYTLPQIPFDEVGMGRDYLTGLLEAYWFAPPVALWRAVELRTAAEEQYEPPVLDLGCGDGLIGQVFFEGKVEVGLDLWEEQVRRAARTGVYRYLTLADGRRMPYPDRYFATVFSNSVLEHIPDVESVVAEVGRVLRPGGRFIFTVPSDRFRFLLDGYVRRLGAGDRQGAEVYADGVDRWLAHRHYHVPAEWEQILASGGMVLVKARYYIPEVTERFWDRMNRRYGLRGRRSLWRLLVSPRLRGLGHGPFVRRVVVRQLSRRWRRYYEMDVSPGGEGGGLLIVARRETSIP